MTTASDNLAQAVVRERQWIYLGPIAAAPLGHIAATVARSAKTAQQKQLILGLGLIGCTVMTVSMRLWLMGHAGYPGKESPHLAQGRIKLVSLEEKQEIERPSTTKQFKEILRGFA